MIDNLEIKNLPYVDDYPEADQKRIEWMRNGECMTGASTKYGSDGTLNAATVGVQRNVERLYENEELTQDKINEVIVSLNNVNDALDIASDTEVIKQIAKNKENIDILQVHMQFAEENIGELYTDTDFLKEDVGVYDPAADSYYRTVRGNIVWLKKELGQYPDQDINGISLPGAQATGIKRRVIDNSSAIVSHSQRIKTLEDNYNDSDVGSLNIKLQEIRNELGPKSEAKASPIYTRLDDIEKYTELSDDTISEIKDAIGMGSGPSINTRVNTLNARVNIHEVILSDPTTGLAPRVSKIETDIGSDDIPASIKGRIKAQTDDLDALEFIVGQDSSSGLRGEVAWTSQQIGDPVSPEASSINGRIKDLQTISNNNASTIQDLQSEIGNNDSGLKGQVLTLRSQMNGTNPNGSTVESRGVILSIKNLEALQALNVTDAPRDDKTYARKNGTWVISDDSDVTGQIEALELAVDGLTSKNTSQDGEIADLDTRLVALGGRVTTAEGRISTQSTDIADLKTDVSAIESDVSDQATEIQGIDTRLIAVEGKVATNTTDITALDGRTTTVEGKVATNTTDITGLGSRLTTVEGKVTTATNDIVDLDTEVSALDTKVAGIDTRLISVEGNISTQDTDISDLKNKNLLVDGKFVTLDTEISGLSDSISDNATAISALDTQVGTNKTDIGTLKTDLAAVKADIVSIKSRLDSLEDDKVEQCPQDGEAYVRVNKTWVALADFLPTP